MSSKGPYIILYIRKEHRALKIEAEAESKRRGYEGLGEFLTALLRKELSEAK